MHSVVNDVKLPNNIFSVVDIVAMPLPTVVAGCIIGSGPVVSDLVMMIIGAPARIPIKQGLTITPRKGLILIDR